MTFILISDILFTWKYFYYLKNCNKIKDYSKNYRLNNADKIIEYRLRNKEYQKEYNKIYCPNNRNLFNAREAKRRATKLNATPKFANLKKIKEIYKNCPKGFHVDHIVPLQNKNVCGLHVEWNLQYLTAHDNQKKSNKLNSTHECPSSQDSFCTIDAFRICRPERQSFREANEFTCPTRLYRCRCHLWHFVQR